MNNNLQLIYPTLDIFLYDLGDGLGQSETKINENRLRFWQKIYPRLTQEELQPFAEVEGLATDSVELLQKKHGIEPFESPCDGYYYPVKLGDTYALQIDCSGEQKANPQISQPLEVIKTLDKVVLEHRHNPCTIGESWVLWGKLPTEQQDAEQTAEKCSHYLSLFADFQWDKDKDLKGSGEFAGATFYELWRLPSDRSPILDNRHLVICLFHSHTDITKIQQLYPHFRHLFQFRNKIIWAYQQSRQLKSDMKQAAQVIHRIVSDLPQQVTADSLNLKLLQKYLADTLTILSTYATYLSRLEEQQHTINSNLKNYQRRLKTFAKLDPENGDRLLNCFEPFADYALEKYQPQLESDIASLSAGLRLLENAIKTIEGIIQLEQTKSDRALSETVAIATVGLGLSAITATVVSTQQPPRGDRFFMVTPPFLWSIGILSPFILWLLLRLYRPLQGGKKGILPHPEGTPPSPPLLRGGVGFDVGDVRNSEKDALKNDIND
ncbi:hypothetical protein [Oscillatoria acuminata]|uniref:Uncharacterized protein n=1 Tax=Oscillatoria acuminata PCC 6304 TaxID=56110 RepID=K9TBG8_9CYAN|nr:hypothetical protein [Oscillatoria acuminata]AFY79875.1 hypothetical protein Oscil6304_0118 [Oscillatoria acuminata PCC 6304]